MNKPLSLAQKLLEIKKRIPYLKPNEKGFGYDYANPSRVLGAFNPLFNEYGILFSSAVVKCQAVPMQVTSVVGDKRKPADLVSVIKTEILYVVEMQFSFQDVETGENITIPWVGTGNNGIEQGYGSALTYAQRYFLLNYFAIPVDKDDPNFVKTIKEAEGDEGLEKIPLKTLTASVAKQMIKALGDKKRTPVQIRTALAGYKNGKQKQNVEEKLLNL